MFVDLLGLLTGWGEFLESVERGISEVSAGRIIGIIGGSGDVGVLGEIDVHLFIKQYESFQVVHGSGSLEIVAHLHKCVIRFIMKDLNPHHIAIIREQVEEDIAVNFFLVQI